VRGGKVDEDFLLNHAGVCLPKEVHY